MNNRNEIQKVPNHFKRVEALLSDRRSILSMFANVSDDEITYRIRDNANLLFYKAIVAEMRSIVEAYDYEFNRTEEASNDNRT